MQVVITSKRFTLTPANKQYLEQKAEKLTKFYDLIQRIDVVAEKQEVGFGVEILVNAEHRAEFIARVSNDDLYAAMDLAVDKLGRQLNDHKERFRNRKHPS